MRKNVHNGWFCARSSDRHEVDLLVPLLILIHEHVECLFHGRVFTYEHTVILPIGRIARRRVY